MCVVTEIDPQILRFFMATTQYRRPIRYSETTLKEAATNLQKLRNTYENAQFRLQSAGDSDEQAQIKIQELESLEQRFIAEMDDDFNTANGITVIYELSKWINQYIDETSPSKLVLEKALELFQTTLSIFGIYFQQSELLDSEIEQLIEERIQARKEKNFGRSDEIRDELKNRGIILEDTSQGTRWRRE